MPNLFVCVFFFVIFFVVIVFFVIFVVDFVVVLVVNVISVGGVVCYSTMAEFRVGKSSVLVVENV